MTDIEKFREIVTNHKAELERERERKAELVAKATALRAPAGAWVTAVLFSPHAAWAAAVVCLALSAGDAYGRGMGFLVAGVLATATAAGRLGACKR